MPRHEDRLLIRIAHRALVKRRTTLLLALLSLVGALVLVARLELKSSLKELFC